MCFKEKDNLFNLAEYARSLHEKERRLYPRPLKPRRHQHAHESLKGIRAVIFDVYGTLVNYWRPGFELRESRENLLLDAFAEIVKRFGMGEILSQMNPSEPPAKTLNDFYNGLIALNYEKSVNKGMVLPEVKIEEVWSVIVMMLARNGYDAEAYVPRSAGASASSQSTDTQSPSKNSDLARRLAYTYNFMSMGRELYPGVSEALKNLKADNIVLGIMSDAQLYTPIDLTLLLRDRSGGKIDDYNELFDPDLTFFSCDYGFVKPSEILFRRLFDALYEYHILPSQTVFVGNDLSTDIRPAAAQGMKTALFCGDDVMVFGSENDGGDVIPDIVFDDWNELAGMISFHGEM